VPWTIQSFGVVRRAAAAHVERRREAAIDHALAVEGHRLVTGTVELGDLDRRQVDALGAAEIAAPIASPSGPVPSANGTQPQTGQN